MLRSIARVSALMTLVVPTTVVLVGGCGESVTVADALGRDRSYKRDGRRGRGRPDVPGDDVHIPPGDLPLVRISLRRRPPLG